MASSVVWWRASAVLAGLVVAMTGFVVVTLDSALDRYVAGHGNIAVVDWRVEVLIDVVAVLAVVTLGALAVATPALLLARRRRRPGRVSIAVLAAGALLLATPLPLWWRFDPVLAYEASVHAAKAGAYGWWYYPALATATALTVGCVLVAALTRPHRTAAG